MRLSKLIDQLPTLAVEGLRDRSVAGLAYDSRRITPGMVYFEVPGLGGDGCSYVSNAIDRGAAAIVCERNQFVPPRATKVKVRSTREALALAAAAYYRHPSSKLTLVGIAGSHGKTCVAFMLRRLLEAGGRRTGLITSIQHEVGDRVIPVLRSTPEALDIQWLLSSMVRSQCECGVLEVSSDAVAPGRVCGLAFDLAVFTNFSPEHLDRHGHPEAYVEVKRRLCQPERFGVKPGGIVVNIDDDHGKRLMGEASAEIRISYGLDADATLRASQIQLGRQGTDLVMTGPAGRFDCRLPLVGLDNVYNALAAAGGALALGVPMEAVREALTEMPAIPGRLEPIRQGQGFDVFVDHARTEAGLRHTLRTLREITTGRLFLAFGCGARTAAAQRTAMGLAAGALADFTVVTSDNPQDEDPAEIAAPVAAGCRAAARGSCAVELDRRQAIDSLLGLASAGDTVLIAGKGHETYQETANVVVPFDDRLHARESLESLGYGDCGSD